MTGRGGIIAIGGDHEPSQSLKIGHGQDSGLAPSCLNHLRERTTKARLITSGRLGCADPLCRSRAVDKAFRLLEIPSFLAKISPHCQVLSCALWNFPSQESENGP